ncbi:4'-phosphopantetheinyl transferase family protein [Paenibacillus sp. Z6-24]
MITVTGVYVPDLIPEDGMERLREAVSEERKQASLKFHRQQDAQRSLIGEALLLHILRERYHLSAGSVSIAKNAYGKPYLEEYPDIYFNISHAGDWIVCADGTVPVGIDIEQVRPIDFAIAERFFTASEYTQLMKAPPQQQLQLFYTLWTLKESYIKYIGKGLSVPLDSFAITIADNGTAKLCPPRPEEDSSGSWEDHAGQICYFRKIMIDANYQLAICAAEALGPKPLVMLNWQELGPYN